VGEETIGKQFFSAMNFTTYQAPTFFEGAADIKYLGIKNGVPTFIGGYGIRTDKRTYSWMMDNFNVNIIPAKMYDPYLYHLDCNVFPIDPENTLMNTKSFSKEDLVKIEKVTNIIPVTEDDAYGGTCNSVLANGVVLNASSISSMKRTDKYYEEEVKRINHLTKICVDLGKELATFDISQYYLSGAMLSCMIMPLNYEDFRGSSINNNTQKTTTKVKK
jgi:N-dimethylarginine dimethylaminohydrolase